MTPDQALGLLRGLIEACILLSGPVLAAALISGIFVGIVQTATQINEPSIAYLVKLAALIAVLIAAGPALAAQAVAYARTSLAAVADVVKL